MRGRIVWWLIVLLPSVVGCGRGPVAVRGRVLLDETPVAWATVTFIPLGDGRPASGLTDANGEFRLTTFQRNDGAQPGEYKVVATKTNALPPPPDAEPGDPDSIINHYKGLKGTRTKKPALPALYGDAEKTPLRCTVPPDGEVVLRLQSNVK